VSEFEWNVRVRDACENASSCVRECARSHSSQARVHLARSSQSSLACHCHRAVKFGRSRIKNLIRINAMSKTTSHRLVACCLSQMCSVVFEHARKYTIVGSNIGITSTSHRLMVYFRHINITINFEKEVLDGF